MQEVKLTELLEAGCHFGHRVEKWHPKATEFIYQPREGIHIIDLAKTRDGLQAAAEYVRDLGIEGKMLMFVATKRQAKGAVAEAAKRAGCPYLTNRWVGGFITNWEAVKKNIDKVNRLRAERTDGSWKQYPKHEIVKLEKLLRQLEMVYGGVTDVPSVPDAMFIVDIKKETIALKEAMRREIKTIAIVDTNADPTPVDFTIPANDDAVGSIQFIVNYIAEAYIEGKKLREKNAEKAEAKKVADAEKAVKDEEKRVASEKKQQEKAKSEPKEVKKENQQSADNKQQEVKKTVKAAPPAETSAGKEKPVEKKAAKAKKVSK